MNWIYILLFAINLGTATSYLLTDSLFFDAYYSESLSKIDGALERLEASDLSLLKNKAFRATLQMKKSGFMKTPLQKIKLFKEGCRELEAVIESAPSEVLYRFLRLTIQEKAPKILKYNSAIEDDANIVRKGYKKLNSVQQKFVLEYAKQSTILKQLSP